VSPALILDCDGVLAETELNGHLPAFNRTFADLGLPLRWSQSEYGRLLSVAGGKERMLHALTPQAIADAGLPSDPERLALEAASWHAYKTEIFARMLAGGAIEPRSGVRRLVAEARAAGWAVAVASTSAEASVRAVIGIALGSHLGAEVEVLAGDLVAHKKPAPDIYLAALGRLGVSAAAAVAIEDSRNGLLAARRAGIACVITRSAFTQQEPMDEAAIVVSELGDPGVAAPRVELNRTRAVIDGPLSLAVLEACLGDDQGDADISG
jgi:HAD superfamily hydrolase (TIGR01509 family)